MISAREKLNKELWWRTACEVDLHGVQGKTFQAGDTFILNEL